MAVHPAFLRSFHLIKGISKIPERSSMLIPTVFETYSNPRDAVILRDLTPSGKAIVVGSRVKSVDNSESLLFAFVDGGKENAVLVNFFRSPVVTIDFE